MKKNRSRRAAHAVMPHQKVVRKPAKPLVAMTARQHLLAEPKWITYLTR